MGVLRAWGRGRLATSLLAVAAMLCTAEARAQTGPPLAPGFVQSIRFTIVDFVVEGNALVATEVLRQALQPLVGPGKSVADLGTARTIVLDVYRAHGLELVRVDYDARRSRNGVHRLLVHEVRIGRVRVTGNQALSEAGVRARLPQLTEGRTPRVGQLARELFLFNDNPGHAASIAFSAGSPGTTDVEVKVTEREQLRAALVADNTGTSSSGRWRVGALVAHTNLWDRGHGAVASFTTSDHPQRVRQYGLVYDWPLPALGDTLRVFASHSDADVGRVADAFDVSGKGTVLALRYQRNVTRDQHDRHALEFGIDLRRYRDTVDFFGTDLGVDVDARPLSVTYHYQLTAPGRSLGASLGYWHNMPGGGRAGNARYGASRAGADAHWRALRWSAAWQEALPADWLLSLRAEGQYAAEPLIAAEQLGLGGMRAVRGLPERDALGDRGAWFSVQLHTPAFAQWHRVFAFFDAGYATRHNRLPGERAPGAVASVGLGWHLATSRQQPSITLQWANLRNGTAARERGEHTIHFSMAWWM